MSPPDRESQCSLTVEVIRGCDLVLLSLKCPISPNSVGLMAVQHRTKTSALFYSQPSPSFFFFFWVLMAHKDRTPVERLTLLASFLACCPFRPLFSDVLQRSQKLLMTLWLCWAAPWNHSIFVIYFVGLNVMWLIQIMLNVSMTKLKTKVQHHSPLPESESGCSYRETQAQSPLDRGCLFPVAPPYLK